jgi:hypothetical protein
LCQLYVEPDTPLASGSSTAGYVLQSLSSWNIVAFVFASACNIGGALAEAQLLAGSPACRACQRQIRWRLIPYLW